jgi:kynurenine formamidase
VRADVAAAGKYGLTQLANPGAAPADWAVVVVVVPLKLVDGTGTPARVLALV